MNIITNIFLIFVNSNSLLLQVFIRIIFFAFYCLFIGDVYYCDDNTYESFDSSVNPTQYRNQPSYQTHYSDGRPIYQPYNEALQYTSQGFRYELPSERINYNDRPIYQAYNEGLQPTSQGYKYELPADSYGNQTNNEHMVFELDGRQVIARYNGRDESGNLIYAYSHNEIYGNENISGSTRIGELNPNICVPTRSEVINSGYYRGENIQYITVNSKSINSRRLYNYVKVAVKNHINKSSKEALRNHRRSTEIFLNNIKRSERMSRTRDVQRYLDMYNPNHKNIKVRRFD